MSTKNTPTTELESTTKNKRPKLSETNGPLTIVTWNCNGFTSRCEHNRKLLQELLDQTNNADIYCLQEVRLKANNSSGSGDRGQPLEKDYKGSAVQVVIKNVFSDYKPFWSLADTKYAGTLTLIRKDLLARQQNQPVAVAFSTRAATNLLLKEFDLKPDDCGIIDTSAATQQVSSSDKKKSSMKSFFAAKPPSSSNSNKLSTTKHHPEGRFQFFRFDGMDFIHTYVPNNGDKVEKWQRRCEWDDSMKDFLANRKHIYATAGIVAADEPVLLWCGDLNVARDYRDGTHWEQRRSHGGNADDSIYEWWTDESKCIIGHRRNKNNSTVSSKKPPDHAGIAGFTPAERRRFNTILSEADFCDVWRELHPQGVVVTTDNDDDDEKSSVMWDQPNWTWRGHLTKSNAGQKSKYEGKGQRLDYFLLSPSSSAIDRVEKCEILGQGWRREGLFCGSDHCAVALTFKE